MLKGRSHVAETQGLDAEDVPREMAGPGKALAGPEVM
jgi:hypothetical protein